MATSRSKSQAPPRLSYAKVLPALQAAGTPTRVSAMRAAIAVILVLGLALLRLVWHAAVLSPRRLHVTPLDTAPVDAQRIADALGRTICHQTISRSREEPIAAEAFEALQTEGREVRLA